MGSIKLMKPDCSQRRFVGWLIAVLVASVSVVSGAAAAAPFVPNDLYFYSEIVPGGPPYQWYLDRQQSSRVDVNVLGAWNRGLTGEGVTIGIVEGAIEYTHPDLAPNYNAAESWDFYENDPDPTPSPVGDEHGTPVAGLAAARGGNGIGITGVAPYSNFASLRTKPGGSWTNGDVATWQRIADGIRYHSTTIPTSIHIKNLSIAASVAYGPLMFPHHVASEQAVRDATAAGTIIVKAAGNYRDDHGANGEGDSNRLWITHLPEAITVTGIRSGGLFASGSNWCACATVTAHYGSISGGILTTDRVGVAGYNTGESSFPDTAYTAFSGTSAAAPLVSGILALAKEANPNLNTRFAKHLLARTSRLIDPTDSTPMGGWITNAAGYHFNNNYGFGLIDANALTLAATQYSGVTPLSTATSGLQSVNVNVPEDNVNGVSRDFSMTNTEPLEEVVVRLVVGQDIGRAWYGDIEAILTAPSGTKSLLMYRRDNAPQLLENFQSYTLDWTFTSNAFWGEDPAGTWNLALYDRDTAAGSQQDNVAVRWKSFEVTMRSGTLIPVSTPLPGDANSDGRVDGDDAVIVTRNLGLVTGAAWENGDFDHDGVVGLKDATILQSHMGPILPSAITQPAHVPEPGTSILAFIAVAIRMFLTGRAARTPFTVLSCDKRRSQSIPNGTKRHR